MTDELPDLDFRPGAGIRTATDNVMVMEGYEDVREKLDGVPGDELVEFLTFQDSIEQPGTYNQYRVSYRAGMVLAIYEVTDEIWAFRLTDMKKQQAQKRAQDLSVPLP